MIIVPANPNLIHVGMVRKGCLKREFSSNYPTRLNGIISQYEFQESIGNINRKIPSTKSQIFCIIIFVLCLIGGFVLLIVNAATLSNNSVRSQSTILIAVGAAVLGVAPMLFVIGCFIIRIRRTNKMRNAIAEESKKYSSRSPIACTWRLNVNRIWTGGYGRYSRSVVFYHVIINIHNTARPNGSARIHQNQIDPWGISTVRSQDNVPPPPYPGQPAAFCSQCGVPRPDLTAQFCSSCGHPYRY